MKKFVTLVFIASVLTACTTTSLLTTTRTPISGTFTVALTAAPSAIPVGSNCRLKAPIQVDFTGALAGSAQGQISILALAPCSEVGTNPPGTFRDTFRAEVAFNGSIVGQTGTVYITYQGNTKPGGEVHGLLKVRDGTGALAEVRGVLKVEAQAGVGGSYTGQLKAVP